MAGRLHGLHPGVGALRSIDDDVILDCGWWLGQYDLGLDRGIPDHVVCRRIAR